MKWQYLVGACGLCALALSTAFVFRGEKTEAQEARQAVYAPPTSTTQSVVPVAKPISEPRPKASKEQTAAELVAIIQETESPDTFLVSLMSLVALDPKDTSILPIAIRKAEKLDLLKGLLNGGPARPSQEVLMDLFEVMIGDKLEHLMHSNDGARFRAQPAPCCAVDYACPAPSFVPAETFLGAGPMQVAMPPQPSFPVGAMPPSAVKRIMQPPLPVAPSSN